MDWYKSLAVTRAEEQVLLELYINVLHYLPYRVLTSPDPPASLEWLESVVTNNANIPPPPKLWVEDIKESFDEEEGDYPDIPLLALYYFLQLPIGQVPEDATWEFDKDAERFRILAHRQNRYEEMLALHYIVSNLALKMKDGDDSKFGLPDTLPQIHRIYKTEIYASLALGGKNIIKPGPWKTFLMALKLQGGPDVSRLMEKQIALCHLAEAKVVCHVPASKEDDQDLSELFKAQARAVHEYGLPIEDVEREQWTLIPILAESSSYGHCVHGIEMPSPPRQNRLSWTNPGLDTGSPLSAISLLSLVDSPDEEGYPFSPLESRRAFELQHPLESPEIKRASESPVNGFDFIGGDMALKAEAQEKRTWLRRFLKSLVETTASIGEQAPQMARRLSERSMEID